jgi:small-conductance mechanosensitive channel
LDLTRFQNLARDLFAMLTDWFTSPQFYFQAAAIAAAVFIAFGLAGQIRRRVSFFHTEPAEGALIKVRRIVHACRDLLFPLMAFGALSLAAIILEGMAQPAWLALIAKSAALIYVFYVAINRFIKHPIVNVIARWIGLPVAALWALGYFDDFTRWLDTVAFSAGNIRISALALAKAAVFGGILFWLGRLSTNAGQRAIRGQEALDIQTRELVAKVLEIGIYCIVAVLLLNILGLDLTALAVFGGAVGVGLGFGLQQIASNFISGIIILLERSLKIGDYIELEDGKAGFLTEINMRSSTINANDGREIMVPNERFITTRLTNWTKTDRLQKYEVAFHVPYDCDIHRVLEIVVEAIGSHKHVLQKPEPPECKLADFAGHGVRIIAEYWVEAEAQKVESYASAIRLIIWDALRGAAITMPRAVELPGRG